eukprot:365480-Chlamydomonas_euryale.AAC.8
MSGPDAQPSHGDARVLTASHFHVQDAVLHLSEASLSLPAAFTPALAAGCSATHALVLQEQPCLSTLLVMSCSRCCMCHSVLARWGVGRGVRPRGSREL